MPSTKSAAGNRCILLIKLKWEKNRLSCVCVCVCYKNGCVVTIQQRKDLLEETQINKKVVSIICLGYYWLVVVYETLMCLLVVPTTKTCVNIVIVTFKMHITL